MLVIFGWRFGEALVEKRVKKVFQVKVVFLKIEIHFESVNLGFLVDL